MRKLFVVLAAFLLVTASFSSAALAGNVEYTWTLAALGQGGWIGGPLFAGGSVGGGGALSVANGQILAKFTPTGWTEDTAGVVTVCFSVTQTKGPPAGLPPTLCLSSLPTGTATIITFMNEPHIFRITENGK